MPNFYFMTVENFNEIFSSVHTSCVKVGVQREMAHEYVQIHGFTETE